MGGNCIVKSALFQFISWVSAVNSNRVAVFTFVLANLIGSSAAWADVLFEIHGLQSKEGHILLALYEAADESSWQDEPLQTAAISAATQTGEAGTLRYRVKGIDAGQYAVRLFHDENNNQKLDSAANGIPLESFAFSGTGPFTGIPAIEQAAFTVKSGEAVVLTLRHPQQRHTQE